MEHRKRYLTVLVSLVLLSAAFLLHAAPPEDVPAYKLTLQLKWSHQFQFAGYYAALDRGYYSDAGLQVAIKPGGADIPVDQEVISGRAQFGVLASELIKMKADGAPLVLLSVIMQHSPRAIIVRSDSDIYLPSDLKNRTIALNQNEDTEFLAMFRYEGLSENFLTILNKGNDANDQFINGRIDGLNGSIGNQPYLFEQRGVPTRLIQPINYGIDFYGDSLFTSEKMVRENPEIVENFRMATLKGWEYAMDHPDEIINLIMTKYNSGKTEEQLKYEAETLRKVIVPDLVDLGHINPHRLNRIAEIYAGLGLISQDWSLSGFLYDPDSLHFKRVNRILFISLSLLALAVSMIFMIMRFLNRRLKNMVVIRTRELTEKNSELEMEIKERELAQSKQQQMARELQQAHKMEALGTLAGGIAHDFNNILGAILGYSELAGRELEKDSHIRKYMDEVVKASLRARDLVRQILAFSRMSFHEKQTVWMDQILREVITFLRATIPASIEIRLESHNENIVVMADPSQIHQIVMNLCNNAVQAIREKGVLSVSLDDIVLADTDMLVRLKLKEGRYARLSVRDTGCGMESEVLHKIFEPYFTTREIGKGSGIGLSVIHGIVMELNGAVDVSSRPGEGSEFHVYIPVLEDMPVQKETDHKTPVRGNERILIVDDDPAIAAVDKQMLEKLGYRTVAVSDSREALRVFQNTPDDFDLLLTDQTMPHMTGSELSGKILEIRPDLPVLLCTGYSSMLKDSDIQELGICGLAMKPLDMHKLSVLVRQALDG